MAASADARISTGFASHPKTLKLIKRLGQAGAWNLIRLFLHAAQYKSNGDLAGMSDEDIELAAGWTGEDGVFVRTLQDVRFLDGVEGARRIHDWADHNPWAAGAPARSEKSRFAALTKQYGRGEAERQMPEYAERIRPATVDGAKGREKTTPDAASEVPNGGDGTANGTPQAMPNSASGTASGTNGECPVSVTVSVTDTVSDSSPSEEQKLQDSLRSSSSTAAPPTTAGDDAGSGSTNTGGTDEAAAKAKAERLRTHTRNAMLAYNATLTRPRGVLAKVTELGLETREQNVRRCLRLARRICELEYETSTITPEFWKTYFAAIAEDPFKSGRQDPGPKNPNWKPTFEYLTRAKTMLEVYEAVLDGQGDEFLVDDGEQQA